MWDILTKQLQTYQDIAISEEGISELVHTDVLGDVAHKERACSQWIQVLSHGHWLPTTLGAQSLQVVASGRKLWMYKETQKTPNTMKYHNKGMLRMPTC